MFFALYAVDMKSKESPCGIEKNALSYSVKLLQRLSHKTNALDSAQLLPAQFIFKALGPLVILLTCGKEAQWPKL